MEKQKFGLHTHTVSPTPTSTPLLSCQHTCTPTCTLSDLRNDKSSIAAPYEGDREALARTCSLSPSPLPRSPPYDDEIDLIATRRPRSPAGTTKPSPLSISLSLPPSATPAAPSCAPPCAIFAANRPPSSFAAVGDAVAAAASSSSSLVPQPPNWKELEDLLRLGFLSGFTNEPPGDTLPLRPPPPPPKSEPSTSASSSPKIWRFRRRHCANRYSAPRQQFSISSSTVGSASFSCSATHMPPPPPPPALALSSPPLATCWRCFCFTSSEVRFVAWHAKEILKSQRSSMCTLVRIRHSDL